MRIRFKFVLAAVLVLTFEIVTSFGLPSPLQRPKHNQASVTKLPYGNPDYAGSLTSLPVLRPMAVSSDRLLVPVVDVLYMLDPNNRIVWKYFVEPNIIYDVRVDKEGMIYVAISDGVFTVLDDNGKEIWGHFMNGSAQYSQIAPYKNGLLVVTDMWGYREKGLGSKDFVEYWENRKVVWSKDFPQQARLEIWGEKILAAKQTTAGKEIIEIR
jgi:outer membrane protein assembly factor BamB